MSDVERYADIAFSSNVSRNHFPYRQAFAAPSVDSFRLELARLPEREIREPDPPFQVVFMFSGQGTQTWGMGRRLFQTEPVFKAQFEACDAKLRSETGLSIVDAVYGGSESDRVLHQTAVAQPPYAAQARAHLAPELCLL